ncbi:alpha/beta fold hydrolase [Jidongwangia harbinensis]|uniref:alpha/beta fold hydrolase n=1 Tax=Jidongwangia harbinensis TaxID=2878561 RepID=UPI001CD91BDD|nr:alpha/beta fold hydrolase [Jidongwangia harbinensis]MCA2215052.1 alpha/beta hydrolase [Jidongwangia harbinensis]
MSFVEVPGVRLHVQRLVPAGGAVPGAPVVVLVHGLLSDNLAGFHRGLAGPLSAAGADVVLYDQRGHGRSTRPPTGYRLPDLVADLVALLAGLGLDRPVHLVGNSFGGLVALHTTLRHPGLVAGLVLLDAQETPEDDARWIEVMRNDATVAALAHEYHRPAGQYHRAYGRARRRDARLQQTIGELLNATSLLDDLWDLAPVSAAALRGVRCPVLAVYGEHSEHLPAGRFLARHLPDCTLTVLAGLTHTILLEGSPAIRSVLLPWLAARTGPAA